MNSWTSWVTIFFFLPRLSDISVPDYNDTSNNQKHINNKYIYVYERPEYSNVLNVMHGTNDKYKCTCIYKIANIECIDGTDTKWKPGRRDSTEPLEQQHRIAPIGQQTSR